MCWPRRRRSRSGTTEAGAAIGARQVELARGAGGLALLSIALNGHSMIAAWSGEFETAASLAAEDEALKEATGAGIAPYGAMLLAAYQGRRAEASALIEATTSDSVLRGEGLGVDLARWTTAILANGLGRYEEALAAAQPVSDETPGLYISTWMLPERIEAAVRSGKPQVAAEALQRFTDTAHAGDAAWACGIEARSRALLSEDNAAEHLYREAIDRLSTTRVRTDSPAPTSSSVNGSAERTGGSTRASTCTPPTTSSPSMGADGFGDRARRELLATGERARKRSVETRDDLTPQEEHIARLARDGRTNPEIGAELYISARTVEWHLRNVFTKLGVTSRKGLQNALPLRRRGIAPA